MLLNQLSVKAGVAHTDPKSHTPVELDINFFGGDCHLQ